MRFLAPTLTSIALLSLPAVAHAQDEVPEKSAGTTSPSTNLPPLPAGATAPPPSAARAANGEYVAPLSQQTQRSYVPQSVALSGPEELTDWKKGDPIPDGYHEVSRLRKGPIIGGSISFGVLYLFSLLAATAGQDSAGPNGSNPNAALYVPAVGPFIQMGSSSSATGSLFLALDGIGQSVGLALLIYGLSTPKELLVRNDLAKTMLVPMQVGKDGYGLGLRTQF